VLRAGSLAAALCCTCKGFGKLWVPNRLGRLANGTSTNNVHSPQPLFNFQNVQICPNNSRNGCRRHSLGACPQTLLDLVSTYPSTSPADREFQVEVSKQQKLLLTYLAQLRGLHRDAHVGARETKAMTAEARQEVDRLHLQLQNLYYEQRHLQGEITACESYEYVESTMIDAERR
jgi:hypothetical protein